MDSVKTTQFKSICSSDKKHPLNFEVEYLTAMVNRFFLFVCSGISFSKCEIYISAFCAFYAFLLWELQVKNIDLCNNYLWK